MQSTVGRCLWCQLTCFLNINQSIKKFSLSSFTAVRYLRQIFKQDGYIQMVPGQNGDNPKWRQDKGNITKTATEKCGQNGDKEQRKLNASKKLLIISSPLTTTALQLGRLLHGSKQTSKKLDF